MNILTFRERIPLSHSRSLTTPGVKNLNSSEKGAQSVKEVDSGYKVISELVLAADECRGFGRIDRPLANGVGRGCQTLK